MTPPYVVANNLSKLQMMRDAPCRWLKWAQVEVKIPKYIVLAVTRGKLNPEPQIKLSNQLVLQLSSPKFLGLPIMSLLDIKNSSSKPTVLAQDIPDGS